MVHVQEFVAAFMEYWDRHRVILRVRDLRAEEGDDRFWAVRRRRVRRHHPRAHREDRGRPSVRAGSRRSSTRTRPRPRRWRCSSASSPTGRCSGGGASPRRRWRPRWRPSCTRRSPVTRAEPGPTAGSERRGSHGARHPPVHQRRRPRRRAAAPLPAVAAEEVRGRPTLAARRAPRHRVDGLPGRHDLRHRRGTTPSRSRTPGSTRSSSRRTSATSRRWASRATR